MKFKVKGIPLRLERCSVMMNPEDAAELGIIVGDRVRVAFGKRFCIADVNIAIEMIDRGEIGVCRTIGPCEMKIPEGIEADVYPTPKPSSIDYIKKKLDGQKLTKEEVYTIVRDIVNNVLTETELTVLITSNYLMKVDFDEIELFTRAMIDTGEKLSFEKGIVVDKHSIGGVPGDKVSLIVVPILAASGLLIPKTASRAITSASGTADTMEVLANVNLESEEIKEITEKVGGVISWATSAEIAPADDKIIRVEYTLAISSKAELLSSVMAKKGAMGAKYIFIDIPVGKGSKVANIELGRELASDFTELGRRLGLNVSCALTDGSQPIGWAIGPSLEAWEALTVLENLNSPKVLYEKSIEIAGALLETAGKARNGNEYAEKILTSGKALEKFREIIDAQGGDPHIKSEDLSFGSARYDFESPIDGAVSTINNIALIKAAKDAGAPKDKGAGIMLHKKIGDHAKTGDTLFTIYAEKDWKLEQAIETATIEPPVVVSGMILERFPSYRIL